MSATVTAWRVECIVPGPQEGRGPYSSQPGPGDDPRHLIAYADWLALRREFVVQNAQGAGHVDTEDDGLEPMSRARDFCACDSLESLRQWFHSGALEALTSSGFYGVVRYEVPATAVQRGGFQVVFDRTQALRRVIVGHTTDQPDTDTR